MSDNEQKMKAVYEQKIKEGRENARKIKGNIINTQNIKGIDEIRQLMDYII